MAPSGPGPRACNSSSDFPPAETASALECRKEQTLSTSCEEQGTCRNQPTWMKVGE